MSDGITLVLVSDTHGQHQKIPPLPSGDVLIHGGDFTATGAIKEIKSTLDWLEKHESFQYRILIAGNHDVTLDGGYYETSRWKHLHGGRQSSEDCRALVRSRPSIVYLEDSSVTLDIGGQSISVYGSPWQPAFCDWGFALERGEPSRQKWSEIPEECDILITHGPPHGILDYVPRSREFVGCQELRAQLESRVRPPRLHVFGHIHECAGLYRNPADMTSTLYVNASSCTLQYRPTNEPIVVRLPFDKTQPAVCLSGHEISSSPNPLANHAARMK